MPMPSFLAHGSMYADDAMRELLLEVEWTTPKDYVVVSVESSKWSAAIRLSKAGFVNAQWSEPNGVDVLLIFTITERGREFLDCSRDPAIWSNIKSTANRVDNLTPEILFEIAKAEGKAKP